MIDYSIEKCFLVTKEDYVNMTVDKNSYLTPKENKIILRVMGMIAVCCGAAAFVSIRESIYQILCWLILILIGFYALSYYAFRDPRYITDHNGISGGYCGNIIDTTVFSRQAYIGCV